MIYPKTKIEIVKLIITDTKDDPDFPWKDFPTDKIIFEWFVTGRVGIGLRLTDTGKVAFEKANISHYDFDFILPKTVKGSSWGKYTLMLDKKIKCPYYVGVPTLASDKIRPYIRVYDHKIAMMITLYGDFQSYINSVK